MSSIANSIQKENSLTSFRKCALLLLVVFSSLSAVFSHSADAVPSTVASGVADPRWSISGGNYVHSDGDRIWVFYYDGSNIVYKYTEDGSSWSSASSTASSTISVAFNLYGENKTVIVTYVNSAGDRRLVSKKGNISGTSISWGSTVLIEDIPDATSVYNYGDFEKINGTLYHTATLWDDCINDIYVWNSTDMGATWNQMINAMCNGDNGVNWHPFLVRYNDTNLLLAMIHWAPSEFAYFTYTSHNGSWSSQQTSSGAGGVTSGYEDMSSLSTAYDWESKCGLVGYIPVNGGGIVKAWKFCNTTNSFSTVESTSTNTGASMTEVPSQNSINLVYARSNILRQRSYNVTNGTWGNESDAFGGNTAINGYVKAENPNHNNTDTVRTAGVAWLNSTATYTIFFDYYGSFSSGVCINQTSRCFDTVQQAINNASAYETVMIVKNSEYNENIVVNVTGITITSNTSAAPTITSSGSLPTVNITARNVTVKRLNIIYSGSGTLFGAVTAKSSSNVTIFNVTINNTGSGDDGYGIYLESTTDSLIDNVTVNTAGGASNYGIFFLTSSRNNITQSKIYTAGTSGNYGIYLQTTSNNAGIYNNTIVTAGAGGSNIAIYPQGTSGSIVYGNILLATGSSSNGMWFNTNSVSNNVTSNNITSASGTAIRMSGTGNRLASNNITGAAGISFDTSSSTVSNYIIDSVISASGTDVASSGSSVQKNYLINTSFNKADITLSGGKQLYVQYRFDLSVNSPTGPVVANALVTGNDSSSVPNTENPTSNFSATTNSTGQIQTQILTEFLANATHNSSSGYLYFTNYTISASNLGSSATSLVNLTQSQSLQLVLSDTPAFWIKTYSNGKARSHFAVNESLVIKAKVLGTPAITIKDQNGAAIVSNANMTNETAPVGNVAVWNYSFSPTTAGWYDVIIGATEKKFVFYASSAWLDGWTNPSGNNFTFKIQLNVSEPGISERFFEPVDTRVNFSFKAHENSIRVTQWNGSRLIEIPSQIYNATANNSLASSANIVFLSSIGGRENLTYYIQYSRSDFGKPSYHGDLNTTNVTNYDVQNAIYRILLNTSRGGVVQEASGKSNNNNLAGFSPMQLSPEVVSSPSTYRASDVSTPTIGLVNGSLFSQLRTGGESGSMRFNLTYSFFSHSSYALLESNVTALSGGTWDSYRDQYFLFRDGIFEKANWKNSTGIFEYSIGSGNGADQSSLGDIDWISAYNNSSRSSFGTVFIQRQQSNAYSPNNEFFDDASFEDYRRTQFAGSVNAGDYFYSKAALVVWDAADSYDKINETFYQLRNPVNSTILLQETSDSENPRYISNVTPLSVSDTQGATCYANWTDNVQLEYSVVTINTSAYNSQATYQLNSTSSWVNFTITSAQLEAGGVTCNMTTYDTSGLSNLTSLTFSASDATPPYFVSMINNPTTNQTLDPNVTVFVIANFTEYTGISSVILEFRNSSASWQNISMMRTSNESYASGYESNFTPSGEGVWQYMIYANDTVGNSNTSEIRNLSVFNDTIWLLKYSGFGAVSGTLGANMTVGTVVINNTADTQLTYRITSNWDSKNEIYFNGTPEGSEIFLTVVNDTYTNFSVIVKAKSTERSDSLSVTATVLNASFQPVSNSTNATIVSFASGPFLLVAITSYNLSVAQGDLVSISARVQNKGNETATNAWLAFELPSGWANTSGALNETTASLAVDSTFSRQVTATAGSSGSQSVTVKSGSSENKTGSASVSVVVIAQSSSVAQPVAGGGGGGGDAGGASLQKGQENRLLQIQKTVEVIRGNRSTFTIRVENPFRISSLSNVSIFIAGVPYQYLTIEPASIDYIAINGSAIFTVTIETPRYLEDTEKTLNLTIRGTSNQSGTLSEITATKSITLKISGVSKTDAIGQEEKAAEIIKALEKSGFNTRKLKPLEERIEKAMQSGDYNTVKAAYEELVSAEENIKTVRSLVSEMDRAIKDSKERRITATRSERLLSLAKASFERGDYLTAESRLKEAQLTYALETKGKVNLLYIVTEYWKQILVLIALSGAGAYSAFLWIRLSMINGEIKKLAKEGAILINLMKQAQRECFEENKMSMEEYSRAIAQYENRLSRGIQRSITLEMERKHLFIAAKKIDMLSKERDSLLGLLKELQESYIEKKEIETRVYESRAKSISTRLAEVEESIAFEQARDAIRASSADKITSAIRRLVR